MLTNTHEFGKILGVACSDHLTTTELVVFAGSEPRKEGTMENRIVHGLTGGRWRLGACLVGLAATMGCGGSGPPRVTTFQVDGQVLLSNGKPLTNGRVTFVPTITDGSALPAIGEIGSDGRFSLTTRDPGDGAAAGNYKVRIDSPSNTTGTGKSKSLFPQKYSDIDNTDLAITVKAETTSLTPFVLK